MSLCPPLTPISATQTQAAPAVVNTDVVIIYRHWLERLKRPWKTCMQWRRAIEALEARAPPDSIATVVNTPCPEKIGHSFLCITSTNVDTVS